MGHRPPLCRRHFNRPHLQYSTCCRQRGGPGAHTPPQTGGLAAVCLTKARLLGAPSVPRCGLGQPGWPAVPTEHPQSSSPEPGTPIPRPSQAAVARHSRTCGGTRVLFSKTALACVLLSRGRHLVLSLGCEGTEAYSTDNCSCAEARGGGSLLHEAGRVGCCLLLPSLPPKLSHSGSH